MMSQTLPEDRLPDDAVPIIYLPGYGKQDLRAIEDCPKPLKPLAELQYRGTLWVHCNGRDWTVTGFLHAIDVPVAADHETKAALARSLVHLASEPVARLRKQAPLDAAFFNALLHPDAARQILLWLSDPQALRQQLAAPEWEAFRALCRQHYAIDPETEAPRNVAQRLADATGAWATAWQRYREAPEAYPGIPALLQSVPPQQLLLFESSPVWPQHNNAEEDRLRTSLLALQKKLPEEVRGALETLEEEHGSRRDWVWARLSYAPLAQALEHLVTLARLTARPLGGTDVHKIGEQYAAWGWKVDAAVLAALAEAQRQSDVDAVKSAVLPLYRKWLRDASATMQRVALPQYHEAYRSQPPLTNAPGTCYLFSDALRYDIAHQLLAALQAEHLQCDLTWRLAALPTVTATAKPALAPVADQLRGNKESDLTPIIAATGSRVTAASLRNLLRDSGWQTLMGDELGDPGGRAWTEIGDLDSYGHQYGPKIAHHIHDEIQILRERIHSLLHHGWKRLCVITDHGWLMLPDTFPKAELPIHLTEMRKGRCAVLKPGAKTAQQTVPWHWNPDVRVAIAPDIHCFEAGKEYEHGGISPQECIVPVITITI